MILLWAIPGTMCIIVYLYAAKTKKIDTRKMRFAVAKSTRLVVYGWVVATFITRDVTPAGVSMSIVLAVYAIVCVTFFEHFVLYSLENKEKIETDSTVQKRIHEFQ